MSPYPPLGQLGPRAISEWGIRTQTADVRVEGLENVPPAGPVMLVARHFHHLLDGSVLVTRVKRPIHIVVGLDWAATPFARRWMERVCRAAQYPIVLRPPTLESSGSYRSQELLRYTRGALRETTRLLRAGRVVLVFPEGYPTIDPTGSRKSDLLPWLPFEPGFLKMVTLAERDGHTRVALVPVGLRYEIAPGIGLDVDAAKTRTKRWSIVARIGPPLPAGTRDLARIEATVKELSGVAAVAGASGAVPSPAAH